LPLRVQLPIQDLEELNVQFHLNLFVFFLLQTSAALLRIPPHEFTPSAFKSFFRKRSTND